MNILIVANHYAVCSARYATDAFKRMGHTVEHEGWERGRDIWGLTLPPEYEWKQQTTGDAFTPELVIVMDSDSRVLDAVGTDKKLGHKYTDVPIIIWGVDNHVRDYKRDYIQHYFLAHRHASVMDWSPNDPRIHPLLKPDWIPTWGDMTWLPCAYDPTLHTPSPIPYFEREFDVCMIGVLYPQRWALVQKLREAGLKVLAGTGLVYEAYVEAYHNSRVSLCVSAAGDLAQRVFETAAMGCCVLTDPVADLVHEDTNEALGLKGFVVYDSEELLIANALELAREPIGEKGAKAIQASVKEHTWDARAQEIVEWYQNR